MDTIRLDVQMLYAGTESFGGKADDVTVATWVTALSCGGTNADEFRIAVEHWIANVGGKTPTPADVNKWARDRRRARIEAENRTRGKVLRGEEVWIKRRIRFFSLFGTSQMDRSKWIAHLTFVLQSIKTPWAEAWLPDLDAAVDDEDNCQWETLIMAIQVKEAEKALGLLNFSEGDAELAPLWARLTEIDDELYRMDQRAR